MIVAVALGAGSALLATSAGGGAADAKPPLAAVSDCKPAPARAAARKAISRSSRRPRRRGAWLETVATAESDESREQAGLARGSLVPEAWGALIDYESLAAENGESPEQAGLARGSLVPEAWGALIDYESLAAVAR